MNFALILLGLILSGIMTLVSVVFTIISLANKKNQNAMRWGIGFIISLAILIVCVFKMVQKVSEKVKTGIEYIEEHKGNITLNTDDEANKKARQEFLDTLQLHLLDKYIDKVPVEFYINKPAVKDAKGLITVPFLYPYLIRYNDVYSTGDIFIEGQDSVFVQNVSQIAFDMNFAIVKVDNTSSPELLKAGHHDIEYLLFDMRSRNTLDAPNNEKLLDIADRIGYTGPKQMQYLSDMYRGWIVYTEYD
jgi:hypothetical protein